ncbi:hypothetical protein P7C70_g2731, partial [Phenoliferia sp. Uapishka_3]
VIEVAGEEVDLATGDAGAEATVGMIVETSAAMVGTDGEVVETTVGVDMVVEGEEATIAVTTTGAEDALIHDPDLGLVLTAAPVLAVDLLHLAVAADPLPTLVRAPVRDLVLALQSSRRKLFLGDEASVVVEVAAEVSVQVALHRQQRNQKRLRKRSPRQDLRGGRMIVPEVGAEVEVLHQEGSEERGPEVRHQDDEGRGAEVGVEVAMVQTAGAQLRVTARNLTLRCSQARVAPRNKRRVMQMQQSDLDILMAAVSPSPSHSHANTPTSGDPHDPSSAGPSSALHALASFDQQHSSAEFADLLAEFTLPGNMLSPEAIGARSPTPGQTGGIGHHARLSAGRTLGSGRSGLGTPEAGAFSEAQDAFEYGRQRLDSTDALGMHASSPGGAAQEQGGGQLAQAIANMDSATQGQLLSALLARQQATAAATQPRDHTLPGHSHYPATSQPSSHHSSPQTFNPYDANQQNALMQQHLAQQYQLAALSVSLPPSHAPSPLASPYYNGGTPQYFPDQHQQLPPQFHQPQPLPQLHQHSSHQHDPSSATSSPQPPPLTYHNAFSPRPFSNQPGTDQGADVQALIAMDALARVSGSMPPQGQTSYVDTSMNGNGFAGDMRIRGGSATGGSYATTSGETEDWGDNDFLFSPLMSPALTPHSTFSIVNSLPPSAQSCLPNQQNLTGITPGDFFPSLGSPAILPQFSQASEYATQPWPQAQAHHTHSNSLQGLVDQTRALGFDASGFRPNSVSPNTYSPTGLATMSPRLGPTDAGQSTSAGSGRRGAGGKKARPSPLLKPTPDAAFRRKKAPGGSEGRSESVGRRSATTSPFLGPTTHGIAALSSSFNKAASNGSAKTSPPENSSGSNNTPSPVDLEMHNGTASSQPELMGPPPLPSSANSSRRSSLIQQSGNGSKVNNGAWMSPVTPASFMNFPAEIAEGGLTQPHHLASTGRRSQSLDGRSPIDGEEESGSTAGPSKHNASKPRPQLPSHASTSSLTASSSTLASRKELDVGRPGATAASIKGKGRAASVSGTTGVRKLGIKPLAKASGGPKIKPLLANGPFSTCDVSLYRVVDTDLAWLVGLPADALARLSTKSNYQNIMDGRGVDLLGLDPSTVSALNATQGVGADNRRTSHKAAEQKRRDSLKLCFEELRRILPPIAASAPDEEKRPGEGNVGGQRGGSVDPENPNRGVSKVALLRRSNEYVGMLHDRIDRRDLAIESLRNRLKEARERLGEDGEEEEIEGLDLDNIDRDEKEAGTMAFYECLDSDDEQEVKPKAPRKPPAGRRKSNAADAEFKGKVGDATKGARRSTRRSITSVTGAEDDSESGAAMDVEDEE